MQRTGAVHLEVHVHGSVHAGHSPAHTRLFHLCTTCLQNGQPGASSTAGQQFLSRLHSTCAPCRRILDPANLSACVEACLVSQIAARASQHLPVAAGTCKDEQRLRNPQCNPHAPFWCLHPCLRHDTHALHPDSDFEGDDEE